MGCGASTSSTPVKAVDPGNVEWRITISMASGESTTMSLDPSCGVAELKRCAKDFFKKPFLQLVLGDRVLLDSQMIEEALSNGATVTAVVQSPRLAATRACFAMWCPGGSKVITFGCYSPGKVHEVPDQLRQVREVVASEAAFAAILGDGEVVAWGLKDNGGDCSAVQEQLKDVQQIAATQSAFAALKADGSVVTWGTRSNGGNSDHVENLKDVREVVGCEIAFAAILADRSVVTWGESRCDQSKVEGRLRDVKQIAPARTGFAALLADGSVVTWPHSRNADDRKDELQNVQKLVANEGAWAAIRADGSIVAFGDREFGGDDSEVRDQLKNVIDVTPAGYGAFAALLQDGSVVTWGDKTRGGDSSKVQDQLKDVQAIRSTRRAFAAILADGSVVTWGDSSYGGDCSEVQDRLKDVQQIVGCSNTFAAVCGNGSLVSWGGGAHMHSNLEEEADVVIIGGGSIGTSTLYHLRKEGVNAVLLERHQLTAGTTWHSAGMLWRLRPSDADIELNAYSREMCKKLEEETEIASWTENGGLFVGTNAERLAEYKRFAETGKYFGIESHVLSPSEVKDVHPLLRVDDIYGGVYSPGDGTIDPTSICNAYAKASRKFGGGVYENVGVSGIEVEDYLTAGSAPARRIKAVLTACGKRIETPTVVNACGAWANEIAAMVGVQIPLKAMKHAMVLTEPIAGMHSGLPNVRDHDLSVYLKTQGDSMAIGGYEQNPEFWPDVDPGFSFGLFELDYDTFGQNLAGHMQRCPVIEETGIKSTVCGPESFTPDHKPLMGPHPGVRGFYHACGFNSMGMMLGGGVGRELTKWILTGSPEVDLFSFDCARFHPESVSDSHWVRDRTHESYAKTYAIVFPHDESLAGRGSRKSALYDELLSRGCVYQARHGFERPGWFVPSSGSQEALSYDFYGAYEEGAWRLGEADHPDIPKHESHEYLDLVEGELTFDWPQSHATVAEECRAAREGVAVFDQSYFGKFYLNGPDADQAVQYLCGADMENKRIGSVTYTPLCNSRGGVEADLTVTKLQNPKGDNCYYFAAGGNTATKDLAWIRKVLEDKNFDAHIEDHSESMTLISVQGPHSRRLLQSLTDSDMSDESLPFSGAKHLEIAGHPLLVLRLTFVGELGFELHTPAESAVAVYRAVHAAGAKLSELEGIPVRDAGYRAIDSLSAEKNLRHWHADLSNRDTPLEADGSTE
ncbi:Sardh, partial [Symbiodinium sp. KB8]